MSILIEELINRSANTEIIQVISKINNIIDKNKKLGITFIDIDVSYYNYRTKVCTVDILYDTVKITSFNCYDVLDYTAKKLEITIIDKLCAKVKFLTISTLIQLMKEVNSFFDINIVISPSKKGVNSKKYNKSVEYVQDNTERYINALVCLTYNNVNLYKNIIVFPDYESAETLTIDYVLEDVIYRIDSCTWEELIDIVDDIKLKVGIDLKIMQGNNVIDIKSQKIESDFVSVSYNSTIIIEFLFIRKSFKKFKNDDSYCDITCEYILKDLYYLGLLKITSTIISKQKHALPQN